MDESEAVDQESTGAPTPIFNVYRRGYDPEQVDRYVTEQQRRLDEAIHRASEAERKLAAAVGQLRELHRRVAVYESEARTAQVPALDTLGERVQRILQEAWEGAYNMRQEAEKEVSDLRDSAEREAAELRRQAAEDAERTRQVASEQAAEVIDEATKRALALRDEMDRRREAYLERVERDRQRAVAQISYLYDQRQLAVTELARLRSTVDATIEEMVHSPLAATAAEIAEEATQTGDRAAGEAVPGLDGEQIDRTPAEEIDGPSAVAAETEAPQADLAQDIAMDVQVSASKDDESATEISSIHVEEVPTGPMETVDYDYASNPYNDLTETPATQSSVEAGRDEAVGEEDQSPKGKRRAQPSLYDVEEEGWT